MGRTKELFADVRQQEADRLDADYEYELWLSKVRSHSKSLTLRGFCYGHKAWPRTI